MEIFEGNPETTTSIGAGAIPGRGSGALYAPVEPCSMAGPTPINHVPFPVSGIVVVTCDDVRSPTLDSFFVRNLDGPPTNISTSLPSKLTPPIATVVVATLLNPVLGSTRTILTVPVVALPIDVPTHFDSPEDFPS